MLPRRKWSRRVLRDKQCKQCKEWFTPKEWAKYPPHNKQKFCSLSCAAIHRNANPKWRKQHSERLKATVDPLVMREMSLKAWGSPEIRAKLISGITNRSRSREHRARMVEHNKIIWANKEFRESQSKLTSKNSAERWNNPDYRNQVSRRMTEENKKRWANPEYKEKVSAAIRAAKQAPEAKARQAEVARRLNEQHPEWNLALAKRNKERWANQAWRKKMSKHLRQIALLRWQNPIYRVIQLPKLLAAVRSPENRGRMSELMKQKWADPRYLAKLKAQWSLEKRLELAEKNKKRWADPKFNARVSKKISKAASTRERKAKVSEESRMRWADPEYKSWMIRRMSEARQ